jgi:hypothetical protein
LLILWVYSQWRTIEWHWSDPRVRFLWRATALAFALHAGYGRWYDSIWSLTILVLLWRFLLLLFIAIFTIFYCYIFLRLSFSFNVVFIAPLCTHTCLFL